jgi:hypothetical protein
MALRKNFNIIKQEDNDIYGYRGFLRDDQLKSEIKFPGKQEKKSIKKIIEEVEEVKEGFTDPFYLSDNLSDAASKVFSNAHLLFHHALTAIGKLQPTPTEAYVTKRTIFSSLQEKKQVKDAAFHARGTFEVDNIELSDSSSAQDLFFQKRGKWIATGFGESENTYVHVFTRQTPDEIARTGGINLEHALVFTNEATANRFYSILEKLRSKVFILPSEELHYLFKDPNEIGGPAYSQFVAQIEKLGRITNAAISDAIKAVKHIITDAENQKSEAPFLKKMLRILMEIKENLDNFIGTMHRPRTGQKHFNQLVNSMSRYFTEAYMPLLMQGINHSKLAVLDRVFSQFVFQMTHGLGHQMGEEIPKPSTPLVLEEPRVPERKPSPSKPLEPLDAESTLDRKHKGPKRK